MVKLGLVLWQAPLFHHAHVQSSCLCLICAALLVKKQVFLPLKEAESKYIKLISSGWLNWSKLTETIIVNYHCWNIKVMILTLAWSPLSTWMFFYLFMKLKRSSVEGLGWVVYRRLQTATSMLDDTGFLYFIFRKPIQSKVAFLAWEEVTNILRSDAYSVSFWLKIWRNRNQLWLNFLSING